MIAHQVQQPGVVGGFAAATGDWQQMRSRLWAHTSLRRASPMRTMESTWAQTPSFTMAPSPLRGAGGRWKKFLSRASLMDVRYGLDPQSPVP
jgi:hypothetical protein